MTTPNHRAFARTQLLNPVTREMYVSRLCSQVRRVCLTPRHLDEATVADVCAAGQFSDAMVRYLAELDSLTGTYGSGVCIDGLRTTVWMYSGVQVESLWEMLAHVHRKRGETREAETMYGLCEESWKVA